MKASELMIGDWVLRKDTQTPYRIDAIRNERFCPANDNYISTGASEDWASISDYQPILLTPAILEKNGFVYEYDYGSYYRSRWGDLAGKTYVVIRRNTRDEVYQYEVVNGARVAYGNESIFLHELQNAMRLCGLEELSLFKNLV